MAKLITVIKAKQDIKSLLEYVDLVETYEADTLDKLINKEYAYTNSCSEVTKQMTHRGFQVDGKPMEFEYVRAVINSKPSDPLHKMLKSGYLSRIKTSKSSKNPSWPRF